MIDSDVRSVEDAFLRSEKFMMPEFDRLERMYQLYRAVSAQGLFNIVTRSQYVVPLIYKTVETVLPRIVAVIFSASPPIQSRYRLVGAPEKLRYLDATFGYLFKQKKLYWAVQSWIKDSLIYGQSYVKVGWRQRKRTRMVPRHFVDEAGQLQEDQMQVEEVVDDTLDVQNINVMDLFFAPEAYFPDPFETSKYVIHRSRKRKSQVIAMRDAGIYMDFDDSQLHPTQVTNDPRSKLASVINREPSVEPDPDDPEIVIYEYWENERLVTEANHEVLLRSEGNPFGLPGRAKKKPFVACCDTLVPGTLWQIGEAEPLEHTQIEESTLRRQRTDNNTLIINRMWIYNKDADVDLEALEVSRPGGGVGARPLDGSLSNAIQPLEQQDLNGASYKEFEQFKQDGQDISGLLDYAVGSAPERRETATTVQLLQTAANLRFDIKIRNYNQSMLELGYMIHERLKQLQTQPIPLSIAVPGQLQPMYRQITRDDLPEVDEVELVAPGNPNLLLKDARRQQMLQYYQTLLQEPMANPQARLLLLKMILGEAEIEGIEPVLAALDMPPPPPPMGMGPPMQPGNGGPPRPPLPPQPLQPQGPTQVNQSPLMMPKPHPSH